LGAAVLPLLVLTLSGLAIGNNIVRGEAEEAARTVGVLREQILRTLEIQDVALSALDAHIQPMSWQQIAASSEVQDFLKRLATSTSTVMSVGIIDPSGNIVASTEKIDPQQEKYIARRGYDHAFPVGSSTVQVYVSAPEVDRPDGRLHVHLARARHGADGGADGGVLLSGFEPSHIENFFRAIAESRNTRFVLARDDGSVLARYPNPVRARGERLPAAAPVLLAAQALKDDASPRVVETGSLLWNFNLITVQKITGYPLFIGSMADPAVVRAAWLRQTMPFAIGAVVAMVLMMLLIAQEQRRLGVEHDLLARRAAAAESERIAAERRAALEERLRQSEKVAALGHLTAGVAHDFNNVLQSIVLGAEDLAQRKLPSREVRELGALILRVAERGRALTQRMLDFARRKDSLDGTTDLFASLQNVCGLLTRSLGGRYDLRLQAEAVKGLRVSGDAAEFEAVIINLVANARDAMPNGGEIVIETARDEEAHAAPGGKTRPASRVRIIVRDTGFGMDQATLQRAGEAFFTTKPSGQGTGLGLSTARGFAGRRGGTLGLASTAGKGMTVTLCLPTVPDDDTRAGAGGERAMEA
jgi:signal transduction histidine kinase